MVNINQLLERIIVNTNNQNLPIDKQDIDEIRDSEVFEPYLEYLIKLGRVDAKEAQRIRDQDDYGVVERILDLDKPSIK